MNSDLIGLAFAAGMVAAFNPCGFAMLPAYLTLVIQRERGGQVAALGRAGVATAAMAAGFVAVFTVFGLLTVSVASTVQRYLPYATVGIGAALVALGVWLLSGREVSGWTLGRGARWAPTTGLGSMFGYGVGYALASLSCTVGPFLAVTGSSLRTGSATGTLMVYAAYAGGIALVVGVLAVAVALASQAVIDRMRRVLPYVSRVSGAILVPVGLYVAYYGSYELRIFGGDGATGDRVVAAAGRVQGRLAGWVHHLGGVPWLLMLGVLIAAVVAGRTWRRRRHPSTPAGAPLDSSA